MGTYAKSIFSIKKIISNDNKTKIIYRIISWGDSLWISGEERSVSDVLKTAEQHDDSFKTNSSTTVWVSSVFEAVNVVFNSFRVNSLGNGSFSEDDWVVDSLGTTEDFFSSHEEIVWASKSWVIFADGRVEWSGFNWVSVKHVEVSIIFDSHWNKTKNYRIRRAFFRLQYWDLHWLPSQYRFL